MSDPVPPAATQTPPPGSGEPADLSQRVLGEFRLLRRLGVGGMGTVYLAEQSSLNRKVALKILKDHLAGNPTSLARFQAEARNAARLTHANIVQVYAIGEADGLHFMALEYVEGRNLRDYLNRKGPLDLPLALAVMRQVCAALQRAGEAGFIHRDIKPENILVTRKVEVKVADFGLSRCFAEEAAALNLTQSGVTLGTPLYMSPEQVQGKPLDPRSDLYSFGVTCYHLLASQPPYTGSNAFEVALQHVSGTPAPLHELRPDLPRPLCDLVARLMARAPEDRPQNAREVLRELNRIRDTAGATPPALLPASVRLPAVRPEATAGIPPLADAPGTTQNFPRAGGRRSGWAWAVGMVTALLLAGAAGAVVRQRIGFAPAPVASAPELAEPARPHPGDEEIARLKKEAEADKNPRGPSDAVRTFQSRAKLLTLLLDRERYDEAEEFARELDRKDGLPATEALAKLGQGIVLAYRDGRDPQAPQHSMDRIKEALAPRRGPKLDPRPAPALLYDNSLAGHVRDAVERNAANGVRIPPEVETALRRKSK